MCLYPQLIKNPKYKATKKNGGNIPPVTNEAVLYVPIGCGDCMECRKQKARHWQARLQEDIKTHKNAKFITLTYSNEKYTEITDNTKNLKELKHLKELEGYSRDNAIATATTRLFLERWRKKYKKSLRHYLITELGHNGTENIHMHGLIWTDETFDTIEQIWNYGWIYRGKYVNETTINYIMKYIHKKDQIHKGYKSIILTSPGIGANYTKAPNFERNKYNGQNTKETYKTRSGHEIGMPIYWRNKRYTEQEREELWIQKINKQERWICGERVDISKTQEQYEKLLKWYQKKNKKLGYGDGTITWDEQQYQEQRRNLMNARRKASVEKKVNSNSRARINEAPQQQ